MHQIHSNKNIFSTIIKLLCTFVLVCAQSVCFAIPEVVANSPIDAATAKKIQQTKPKAAGTDLQSINKSLSVKNATLEQENNALQTQVNVLTQEKSSQLFITGAFIAIGGIFLGFIAAWLLLGRRSNDW